MDDPLRGIENSVLNPDTQTAERLAGIFLSLRLAPFSVAPRIPALTLRAFAYDDGLEHRVTKEGGRRWSESAKFGRGPARTIG
jgi:hypothetical protein